MNDFLTAALGLPTLIFTVGLVLVVAYWVLVILGGIDSELFGGGGDATDGIELGGGGGPVSRLIDALGITTVPSTVVLSFVVLFSWFFSLALSEVVDGWALTGAASLLAGIGVVVVALSLSLPLTALAARPFRGLFVHTPAAMRRSLVGKLCTVRTGSVSDSFGQAEIADEEGASLLVQVRCPEANDLGAGDLALIYAYDDDDEVFIVARADESLSSG